jgi:uncharacterized protein YecT (DUF1311 family)
VAASLLFLTSCDREAAADAPVQESPESIQAKAIPDFDSDRERFSPQYFECLDDGIDQGSNSLGPCSADEHERQDAKLNQVYSNAMERLSVERREQLRDSQRLWLQRRDLDCNLSSETAPQFMGCLLYETADRVEFIETVSALNSLQG